MPKEKAVRIALWLAVAAVLAGSLLWIFRARTGERVIATITVENKVVRTIDLSRARDQEFSILEETGMPITFQVRDHAIRFLESDCPDKVCVNTGFLKNDLDVACCLPNRTTLFISREN